MRSLRRIALWTTVVAVGLVLALATIEVGFRLAGLAMRQDPAHALADSDDRFVVLCAGDSHTWGLGRGYPAALADRLSARSAHYRVLNLGVPASTTASWRRWLPDYEDRFHPRVVVFWAGINNWWNRADADVWSQAGIRPLTLFGRIVESSRAVRFVRAWRHHADLRRLLAGSGPLVAPPFYNAAGDDPWAVQRRRILDAEEVHSGVGGDKLGLDELERVTALDIGWLADASHERGIPFLVVTYPIQAGPFVAVNAGIERATVERGVPTVDGHEALRRLTERAGGENKVAAFDSSVHPTQVLYDEIGAAVYDLLARRGLLPE
jgi:lysophospholipase L1-like esterase